MFQKKYHNLFHQEGSFLDSQRFKRYQSLDNQLNFAKPLREPLPCRTFKNQFKNNLNQKRV